jgi:hypothetical protein
VNSIELLRNRASAVTATLHSLVDQAGDVDLARPVVAGTSPLGLTLWHIPRTQDWLLNTTILGRREVADDFEGRLPDPERYGFGTGLSGEAVEQAAAQVDPADLLRYADAVGAAVDTWLGSLSEADLDAVPPLMDRQQTRPAYSTPQALEEVSGLAGLPVGVLLLRPGLSHLLWHMGEVDLLLQLDR